ncbi:MAG: hypothetical protein HYS18_13125 [Burkholderiales bacterium]|nr:hypothetical protein [Burkholderiales bacterium]
MNDADKNEREEVRRSVPQVNAAPVGISALKPKGACWYCNAPLDNVRRFCSKTCAQDYQTEEEAFR